MITDEYQTAILNRLGILAFVSGESNLKLDSISRFLTSTLASSHPRSVEAIRPYVLDWDRNVRSAAFRALRYMKIEEVETEFIRLSLDKLVLYRLESCKSAIERISILRFIAAWLNGTRRIEVAETLLSSILELIIGHLSQSPAQAFLTALIDVFVASLKRFPFLKVSKLRQFLQETAGQLSKRHRKILYYVVQRRAIHSGPMCLPENFISPELICDLGLTVGGLSILASSIDPSYASDEVNRALENAKVDQRVEIKSSPKLTPVSGALKESPRLLRIDISGNVPSIARAADLNSIERNPTRVADQLSEVISQYHLVEGFVLHPVIYMWMISQLIHAGDFVDVGAVTSVHGFHSDLLWLRRFKHDRHSFSTAIESGWVDRKWKQEWLPISFDKIYDGCLEACCHTGIGDGMHELLINGGRYKCVVVPCPTFQVLNSLGHQLTAYSSEILWASPLSLSTTIALIDDPVVGPIIEIKAGPTVLKIDTSTLPEMLESCIGGRLVCEYNHTGSGYTLMFDVTTGSHQLIAVCLPIRERRSGTDFLMSELLPLHFAYNLSTPHGCEWLQQTKTEYLERCIQCIRSGSESSSSAVWFFGALCLGGQDGYELAKRTGFIDYMNSVNDGSVTFSTYIKMLLLEMSAAIGLRFPTMKTDMRQLTSMKPEETISIPILSPLPLINSSSNPSLSFTQAHVAIMREIDSLASSVHFKKKCASLNDRRQESPELFLSVPLWKAVMDRVCIGRFPLQARRTIHGLFLHTFFEMECLSILDSLSYS
jgi:hypothetical protein